MKWPTALFISTAILCITLLMLFYKKAPDYVGKQNKALNDIRQELDYSGENCFVDWETGEVWARMDINKHSVVRCSIDPIKKLKHEFVQMIEDGLEPLFGRLK
jgi:hypothetical protein